MFSRDESVQITIDIRVGYESTEIICLHYCFFFFFNSARMHKLDQKEHLTHLKQVK